MSDSVEVITIGDELLLGFTVDTNGAYLARKLAELGISVARRTSVGDTMDAIVGAVREALDRTGAVITTGGLGPTTDDLTREAVAALFGRKLVVDEEHLEWMRNRWRTRFGRELPDSNRRQAMLPQGARKLTNGHGSAPGVFVEDDQGRWAVLLPGVPRELRGMTEDALLPLLRERGFGTAGDVISSRTLRTTGVAESLLQDRISGAKLGDVQNGVSLAYLPGVDGVDLRLTVHGSPEAVSSNLDFMATALRTAVGDAVYGENEQDLAAILLDVCRAKGLKAAVAESCTGGLLGERLTAIPGSSDVFVGGVIAYSNEVKVRDLGVSEQSLTDYGAVSEQVVSEMAAGARKRFGVDLAFAITGIAGPGGGTAEKPVGLVWIAVALGGRIATKRIQSWGDRQEVRYRAAQAAMELARRLLSE